MNATCRTKAREAERRQASAGALLGQLKHTSKRAPDRAPSLESRLVGPALVQRKIRLQRGVLAGITHANDELAWIDNPFVCSFTPIAEGASVQGESDAPGFAWCEANLLKSLQFPL